MLALLFSLLVPAEAGPLAVKRSRAPLPALSVERGLVLPTGWFELSLQHSSGDARHRQDLALRYGIATGVEAFGILPVHEADGRVGPGDSGVGLRFEVVHSEPPTTSVAMELGLRAPTGPSGRSFSTDGVAPWVGVAGTRQLGALVFGLHGEVIAYRGSDPSLQRRLSTSMALQGGPLVLRTVMHAIARRREADGRLELAAELHVSRGFEVGFVADLLIQGTGEALPASRGGGPSRLGGVLRVHF